MSQTSTNRESAPCEEGTALTACTIPGGVIETQVKCWQYLSQGGGMCERWKTAGIHTTGFVGLAYELTRITWAVAGSSSKWAAEWPNNKSVSSVQSNAAVFTFPLDVSLLKYRSSPVEFSLPGSRSPAKQQTSLHYPSIPFPLNLHRRGRQQGTGSACHNRLKTTSKSDGQTRDDG